MRIELCEDNGFMNCGKPTLVVLVVTDDDGKQRRVPYEANKTIQQLYTDLGVINFQKITPDGDIVLDEPASEVTVSFEYQRNPNEIEREDLVKCVKAYEREGNNDLKVGEIYRVMDIKKINGSVEYYEIVDDKAPAQYRIQVAPEEIELSKKAPPKAPKNTVYKDIIKLCDCGTENALVLAGDKYTGKCTKCGKQLVEQRKEVNDVH